MAKQERIQREKPQLLPVNFTNLISEFALAASVHLGQLRKSETDDTVTDLGMARHMIDTIKLLKEKTQGNLTTSEGEFLERVLHNLKMGYVRAAQNPLPSTQSGISEEQNQHTTSNATAAENH